MKKRFLSVFLFVILLFSLEFRSSANSAVHYYQGSTNSGLVSSDEDCPLEVEKEELTFHISTPIPSTIEKLEDIKNIVSAKYSFYNPTDMDVKAHLVFPLGDTPEYFESYYNEETDTYEMLDDSSKYQIKVENQVIESSLRHTYSSFYKFNLETELSKLKDDYAVHPKYKKDTLIFECNLKLENYNKNKSLWCVYHPNSNSSYEVIGNNFAKKYYTSKDPYYVWETSEEELKLIFINQYDENIKDCITFYEDYGLKKEVQVQMNDLEVKQKTFEDLAFKYYKEEYGISKIDWYNALIDRILEQSLLQDESIFDMTSHLMRWYSYDLTVPAKKTVVNEVISPVYPNFQGYRNNIDFTFNYLLSPASSFANFKDLTIIIETDLELEYSSLNYFTKIDDGSGYILELDTLPFNELSFTLSSNEGIGIGGKAPKSLGVTVIVIFSIFFLFLPILVLFLVSKYKKSKELNNLTNRFRNFLFVEGVISVLMFFLGIAGLAISSQAWFSITACVMCIILLSLLIFERIKCLRKFIGRMIVISITILFYIFTFIFDETWADMHESLCCISLVFSVILYIIILVSLAKLKNTIEDGKIVNQKNRYYPVSYLSVGWLVAIYINVCVMVAFIIAAIILYANGFSSSGGILCICGGIASLVFIFVLAILMSISNNKPFKEYFKDLDYEKLEKSILERLKNPKINPETINYFKLQLANVALKHSVKRHFELMDEVVMPKNKLYKIYYDILLIHSLLPYEDIKKKSNLLLAKYPKNLIVKRHVPLFLKKHQAMEETGFADEDIHKIAPYDTKNNYLNAYNLFIQIHYYMKQGNEIESENLKKLFFQNYSSLQTLVDDLNGINMKEKYKELEQENPIIRCPQCAYPMKSTMRFCSNCGKKLKEEDEQCPQQENI